MAKGKLPINPEKRGKRRAVWQDYMKPCFYMITLAKNPEAPLFSQLYSQQRPLTSLSRTEIDPSQVYCSYSPIGFAIREEMAVFNKEHPEAQIMNRVIMPDHIHFLFHVKKRLRDKSEFGRLIAQFKGACSRAYANLQKHEETAEIIPMFERGYNDLICFRRWQLDKIINYIKNNPRRLAFRKLKPDLFTSTMKVKIGEKYYKVIGNIFLLKHPLVEQVRFSRNFTAVEWSRKKSYLQKIIEQRGVVVSPFIHPEENKIFKEAEEEGANIIYIRNRDYGERDKPEGRQ